MRTAPRTRLYILLLMTRHGVLRIVPYRRKSLPQQFLRVERPTVLFGYLLVRRALKVRGVESAEKFRVLFVLCHA